MESPPGVKHNVCDFQTQAQPTQAAPDALEEQAAGALREAARLTHEPATESDEGPEGLAEASGEPFRSRPVLAVAGLGTARPLPQASRARAS